MKRYILILLTIFFVSGCAIVRPQFIDPTGREIPTPHYVSYIPGTPMSITFYYTAYQEVHDIDGTRILKPTYLDFMRYHKLPYEKYQGLTLTIEINNPSKIKYYLYHKMRIKESIQDVQADGEMKKSNLGYRQFVYNLPYWEDLREVDNIVTLNIDELEVLRIGSFRYTFINEKGGE
jgi:hypothetical protein